jgi:hypothetical protein
MLDFKILRIIASTIICFLLTSALLDGFIFNVYTIKFLTSCFKPNKISSKLIQNHKLKTLLCFIIVIWSLYFLLNIFNRNYFKSQTTDKKRNLSEASNSKCFKTFFKYSAIIFLIYLIFVISALIYEKSKDDPIRVSFNKKYPISRSNRGLKRKFFFLNTLSKKIRKKVSRSNSKGKVLNSLESLSWNILELDYLKLYHLKFRYVKHQFVISTTLLIILLIIIRNR